MFLQERQNVWQEVALPGIANDQAAEHCSNTSSWAGHSDCGGSGTNELGGSVDVPRDGAGLEGACHECRLADWQQGLKEDTEQQSVRQPDLNAGFACFMIVWLNCKLTASWINDLHYNS